MRDQAERLRQIISNSDSLNNDSSSKERKTRVIAVTSGKGGVGKTNFTINLAISLSNLGYKVLVFDADIGLANIDVILGVIPKHTIADVIWGRKNITDIIVEGPKGISMISGGSGITELMDLDKEKLDKITIELSKLENYADFILIDTGAGLSNAVLNFVHAADEAILITTPEPTSLTDVYAMIKALTISSKYPKLNLVINSVENSNEAEEVYTKLDKVVSRFLKVKIADLGYIEKSKSVIDAVKNQTPFTILFPNSNATKRINSIALKLLGSKDEGYSNEIGLSTFINKFRNLFNKGGINSK